MNKQKRRRLCGSHSQQMTLSLSSGCTALMCLAARMAQNSFDENENWHSFSAQKRVFIFIHSVTKSALKCFANTSSSFAFLQVVLVDGIPLNSSLWHFSRWHFNPWTVCFPSLLLLCPLHHVVLLLWSLTYFDLLPWRCLVDTRQQLIHGLPPLSSVMRHVSSGM